MGRGGVGEGRFQDEMIRAGRRAGARGRSGGGAPHAAGGGEGGGLGSLLGGGGGGGGRAGGPGFAAGARVRVREPGPTVFHTPKMGGEGLCLGGLEGTVLGFANDDGAGGKTTANPPVQVQFQHEVERKGEIHAVDFVAHLQERELEML